VTITSIETEIASLAQRYGAPRRVTIELAGMPFDPLTQSDRIGEVCMVVRRPNGRLITARKTFYPRDAFRLLTGGIGHGESIAAALLRETDEETGLDVAVRQFLALIHYRQRGARELIPFITCAFLLDEVGGVLAPRDPAERIAAFREVTVDELPAMAATLARAPEEHDDEIGGRWRDWGEFRAAVHRVVYAALAGDDAPGASI
jgi:ADP-ribose pyrophosphatase YjhB (NUDIX family)